MKKLFALVLALLLCLSVLTACGGSNNAAAPAEEPAAEPAAAPAEEPAAEPAAEEPAETVVLNVAASSVPHAEILELVVDDLAAQGIDLQIHEYGDYVVPNTAVEEGAEDVNFFQHLPYLENFNAENGTHLVSVAGIHIEPMGIYSETITSLDQLADGASVALPNDVTNEARSLLLLEAQGLITLDAAAGLEATPNDIVDNPLNLTFNEVEAAMVPNIVSEVDIAVINSNYAMEAGFNPVADSLAIEDAESPYVNILVVKEGNENDPAVQALIAAIETQKVYDFIIDSYGGAVVPVFAAAAAAEPVVAAEPGETVTLNVAASSVPHAEILEQVVAALAEQGVDLQIHEYGDYVVPNTAVEEGAEDVNFFQHLPYLENFNAENGTHLVSVAGIHIEPMGVYSETITSLDQLADGASVALPNDVTNEARSLLLLEAQGLITLDEAAGLEATPNDIVDNPLNLTFTEVEAAMVPNIVSEVDIAVINSNYAMEAGFNPVADSLAIEDAESPYVNILVVKEGNENNAAVLALIAAIKTDAIRDFILDSYDGAVVPVF